MVRILVDVMGGDNAPDALVNGCIEAVKDTCGFDIVVLGDSNRIKRLLKNKKYDVSRIVVKHCDQVITGEDIPVKAVKTKKDSSMIVGLQMLKEKEGDVFLSAGNSGALMAGSLMILGRNHTIDRPALAAVLPTRTGTCLLLDAGLNTLCKPINLVQFAHMGSLYAQEVLGIKNPRIGLLNVGTEENKGNDIAKKAHGVLSNQNLNFVGNVESREILYGASDVVVTDGFTGNMVLKAIEGSASFVYDAIKGVFARSLISRISAALVMRDLKKLKQLISVNDKGGAPILGINGLVLKSHGSSSSNTIKYAVLKAFKLAGSTFKQRMFDMTKELALNMDKNVLVI